MFQLKVGLLVLAFAETVFSSCGSYYGSVCCAGFFWKEETARCEKCPTGFYRTNCSERCKYPNFGEDCQGACTCAEYLCNFVTGCGKLRPESNLPASTFFSAEESTYIKIVYKEIIVTEQSVATSGGSDYFQMGIFILVGILVVFIGLFVVAYFYKHFHVKRDEIKIQTHLRNQELEYKGLDFEKMETNEIHEFHNDPIRTEPAYLQAVDNISAQYEDVVSKNTSSDSDCEQYRGSTNSESEQCRENTNTISEDAKRILKENTYLSPESTTTHVYVEVEESNFYQ